MTINTITYTNTIRVSLNTSSGTYSQLLNFNGIGSTIYDDAGGNPSIGDGQELANEVLNWSIGNPAGTASYTGWMINGEPIIKYNSLFYLLTNSLANISPGIATQGTYFYCFLTGTQIHTPTGTIAVEELRIGDDVLSHDGQSVKVRFNFSQQHSGHFFAGKQHYPVKISAHAIAENVPNQDLYVSPDHAIYLPELHIFVEANALINGVSIVQVDTMPGQFTYHHILCENQEIILAENTPVETFVDNVTMERFDNYAAYLALYPEDHDMSEQEIPRAKSWRQLPQALKQKLLDRATLLFPDVVTKDAA